MSAVGSDQESPALGLKPAVTASPEMIPTKVDLHAKEEGIAEENPNKGANAGPQTPKLDLSSIMAVSPPPSELITPRGADVKSSTAEKGSAPGSPQEPGAASHWEWEEESFDCDPASASDLSQTAMKQVNGRLCQNFLVSAIASDLCISVRVYR